MNTKKTISLSLAAVLILGLSALAFAGPGDGSGRGRGMGYGEGPRSGCWNAPALSEEQEKELGALHEAYIKQAEPVARDLRVKEFELQAEMAKQTPDAKKVDALVKDVSTLRGDLFAKHIRFMENAKAKGLDAGFFGRGHGRGHGMGMGMGKGMGMGPGYGHGFGPGFGPDCPYDDND